MPADSSATSGRQLVRDPIYFQLNELLKELVASGEFQPGSQFLTEREVAARFGVSRVTANKALSHLVTAGLLQFRKGVGTFVRESTLDLDVRSLVSFTARARAAGREPTTQVLIFQKFSVARVTANIAGRLGAAPGEDVFYFERLRKAGDEPLILEHRYVRARLCPGLTEAAVRGSLYEAFTVTFGLKITGAEQVIRAVDLSSAEARLLTVRPGSAALSVEGVGATKAGPLWHERTLYRGDRYEFRNVLGGNQPPRPASPVLAGGA
jgi:GntR family transcriptional regulator